MIWMCQQAFAILAISAEASVRVVWALENMTLGAIFAIIAESEGSEWTADRGRRGDVNMRVQACFLIAVASNKMGASWYAMVSRRMRQVAGVAGGAGTGLEECLADGDLFRVMGEFASRTKRAITCQDVSNPSAAADEQMVAAACAGARVHGTLGTVLCEVVALLERSARFGPVYVRQ